MRALSDSELLDVWDRGQDRHPIDQALLLVREACPELSRDAALDLPLGRRDALLLELRERTFGPAMRGGVACPRCRERLELDMSTAELRGEPEVPDLTAIVVEVDDLTIVCRSPASRDLAALARAHRSAGAASQRALLARCILDVRDGAEARPADDLPPDVIDRVSQALLAADPMVELCFALCCPQCAHCWGQILDVHAFLWREIEARAGRLLDEVLTLARGCGWRETDILAMTPSRRRAYLELLGA